MWLIVFRAFVVVILAAAGFFYSPFPGRPAGLALGLLAALGVIALEVTVRLVPGPRMVGGLVGGVTGLIGARLVWGALEGLDLGHGAGENLFHTLVVVLFGYVGLVIGGQRAEWFEPARIIAAFRESARLQQHKILDTSVVIDGRIADICETGFLEGTLVVPQFVLRELQQVADSSDSLKRNRGRRGLDILQKIRKMPQAQVQIVETDFPELREVDLKLIELARRLQGKIVTNDFNLNKVAQLRGVSVLNINDLANSLKPVVLPGEVMRVFVVKEGKEVGQGVGYLDDGTMVVVDQARRAIGRTIEVTVTSVLQTTAGKMIFCRWGEAASDDAGGVRREARGPERREGRNGREARPGERREGGRPGEERPACDRPHASEASRRADPSSADPERPSGEAPPAPDEAEDVAAKAG